MNIRLNAWQKLAIAVAVQLVIIGGVLGFKQYTIWTGETVRLAVGPYDPRDPFRGDYVTLSYDISVIEPGELIGQNNAYGDVYVELREGADGVWDTVAIHDEREREFEGTVLLKGEADYRGTGTIRIEYGIEEVFIPEGSGRDIPWREDLQVEVKVDRFGNAVLRHLLVDGEKLDLKRR
jgi:uncharacterized membrane-anchored protein